MIKLFDEIEKNNNIIDRIFKFNNTSINTCLYNNKIITNTSNIQSTTILSLAITESENLSISKLLDYDQRIENLEGYTCGVINPETNKEYTEEEWNSDITIEIGEKNYTKDQRQNIKSTKQQKIENFSDYLLIHLMIFLRWILLKIHLNKIN